ncbi:fibronectin type III domain-containing protein [Flavivirga eckloniae]|uniref:Metallophosphoesterase n=1 Tax=Flavivirga eckloniae TaxID=1803846 RepID=A0A2K9PUT9_9FLAO|nr:fibronectin type III domain-containing protein [Flavivirga eckloniae]AUP80568.1 metallophosphoesterase [Flavivirga eckloniae]
MKHYKTILLSILIASGLSAQTNTLLVQPYLQDATPNSIKVMWETKSGEESIVEWGKSKKLGKVTSGHASHVDLGNSKIHEVKIEGLKRFTNYYYRVKSDAIVSDIFQFKTPPLAKDKESFNIIVMSDMQQDSNHSNVFSETVDQGILTYLKKEFKEDLPNNLAMVLVPGDLVEHGNEHSQWQGHFFNPGRKLFSKVPVYPVLGSHEKSSGSYFEYFSLPENGTPEYAAHWWYKDYSNVRIIGLDSNEAFGNIDAQLKWLKKILKDTASNENIDFVFAQWHHPYKSELRISGETDVAGKAIKALEAFTTSSGKPSLHFFGHTHGYSRGQSRDSKHLWINVASAGGAIDNWNESDGKDYDEFTVTHDEYGFLMVEVVNENNDPKFTIKRISRGNKNKIRYNELRDSITIYKKARKPETPMVMFPNNGTVPNVGVVLNAGPFKSKHKKAFHAASHWQVSKYEDFKKVVMDVWKQNENWYNNENLQKDYVLTKERLEPLESFTTYYWRVRYRDQNLNWSDWSDVLSFKTN